MTEPDRDCQQAEKSKRGSRVAFFGGSFDPPHLGHLAVAKAARAAFRLDTIMFAPVGAQPLKPEGSTASFADRLAMTKLAIAGEPGFAVSLLDAPKPDGAPNFSVETLEGLRAELGPDSVLFCLMGADSFFALQRWHRATEVPFVAPLIVASRPGESMDELGKALPPGLTLEPASQRERCGSGVEVRAFCVSDAAGERAPFYVLPGLHVDISASEIRRRLHAGSVDLGNVQDASHALLPGSVAEYIRDHGLYR